jgi:3-oxoacyl-[acyl-carrier-protein] synthase I
MQPCPITAYALCNALGEDVRAVTEALEHGRSGLRDDVFVAQVPTFLGHCDALEPLPASLSAYDTRQTRLAARALAPMIDAVAGACKRWGSTRVAIVVGTSTGGIAATERAWAWMHEHGSLPAEFDLHRHHAMQATVEVVRAMTGARGPGHAISTACSSSAKAFASAQRWIEADLADAVVVGGVDSLCELTVRGFAALELTSTRPCRPFAADRDGISIGEGGAFALLERRGDAATQLLAVGESCDAYHMSAPHPEGAGAIAAMRQALALAGLEPARIGFVNAHATGTRLNDAAEARAIATVLGSSVPVVATKGYTGHLLGAAGATELLLAVIALERGFLPASLGATPRDPSLPIHVVESRMAIEADHALSTSFAFGGSNAAVIVGVVA